MGNPDCSAEGYLRTNGCAEKSSLKETNNNLQVKVCTKTRRSSMLAHRLRCLDAWADRHNPTPTLEGPFVNRKKHDSWLLDGMTTDRSRSVTFFSVLNK